MTAPDPHAQLAEIRALTDAVPAEFGSSPDQLRSLLVESGWAAEAASLMAAAPAALPRLLDALEAVHKIHVRGLQWQSHPDDEWSWDRPEDVTDLNGDPVGNPHSFAICEHCGDLEIRTPDDNYREALWPCPTVRAITDALGGGQ